MDPCHLDATELVRLIRRRDLSAREVVAAHLERIEQVNPAVNAIVSLDAEGALVAAGVADERLAGGAEPGPLHGLPIAFKDTHLTRGMRTTYGSPLLADFVPGEDELLVQRIQRGGAIRIGKTNVPEFAAGSHTFNPVFGATRNPYDLGRSAGGSSGGAAAALAAGLQPIADGSDMGGSLRNPASFCNVVGLRTTPGRVPLHPVTDAWGSLTVAGPMGRTVADAALLLSVMAGPDPRAPISLDSPGADLRPPLAGDLHGLRVAWAPDLGGRVPVESDVRDVLAGQVEVFAEAGCLVEEACPDLDGADDVFRVLRAQAFEQSLGAHLDCSRDALRPSLVRNIEEGRRLSGADLARAAAERTRIHLAAVRFFERYDVLLAPVSQVAPFPVEWEYPYVVDGQLQHTYIDWMRSAYLLSVLAAPALSVPAGFTPAGLPVGLQIVGPPRADRAVLAVGAAYEAATGHGRRRPSEPFSPSPSAYSTRSAGPTSSQV
ncbi:amidase [Streptomyces sp. Je 1-369]|uniref:amidase n=1 Tax=Streptomyces sp. Je 1-369 TaxID=2966192 RepID=UPI0022868B2C|nr:amidase [Streptomyces sp. Je 1-369]WAL97628.1 amidase [Streptomyces sp. Je 1-369]